MTTFDKREDAFENRFAHDAELQFKAEARRNKLLGLWAAGLLGKTGAAADAYAKDVIAALKAAGLRTVLDTENQTVNYKVRQHSLVKTPNLLVLGRREAENRTVTLRKLGVEKQESLALADAVSMLMSEAVPPDLR